MGQLLTSEVSPCHDATVAGGGAVTRVELPLAGRGRDLAYHFLGDGTLDVASITFESSNLPNEGEHAAASDSTDAGDWIAEPTLPTLTDPTGATRGAMVHIYHFGARRLRAVITTTTAGRLLIFAAGKE